MSDEINFNQPFEKASDCWLYRYIRDDQRERLYNAALLLIDFTNSPQYQELVPYSLGWLRSEWYFRIRREAGFLCSLGIITPVEEVIIVAGVNSLYESDYVARAGLYHSSSANLGVELEGETEEEQDQ